MRRRRVHRIDWRSGNVAAGGAVYRIAIVHPSTLTSKSSESPYWRTFFGKLRRLGYDKGRNLAVEVLKPC